VGGEGKEEGGGGGRTSRKRNQLRSSRSAHARKRGPKGLRGGSGITNKSLGNNRGASTSKRKGDVVRRSQEHALTWKRGKKRGPRCLQEKGGGGGECPYAQGLGENETPRQALLSEEKMGKKISSVGGAWQREESPVDDRGRKKGARREGASRSDLAANP